jgi:hypothetical protein
LFCLSLGFVATTFASTFVRVDDTKREKHLLGGNFGRHRKCR